MPNFVFENYSALFTYGVGNDDRFEIEFAKIYQKPVYLFNHTIFALCRVMKKNKNKR